MEIKITEEGSLEFYKETVNVLYQCGVLMKNHGAKLRDYFRSYKRLVISCIVLFVIATLFFIFGGYETINLVIALTMAIAGLFSWLILFAMKKSLKDLMNNSSKESILRINEEYVELESIAKSVKLSWNSIAFVRAFDHCICFIPKDQTGILISVDKKISGEIIKALDKLNIEYSI